MTAPSTPDGREELAMPIGATHYRTRYWRGGISFVTKVDRICADRRGSKWRLRVESEALSRLMAGQPHGPIIVDLGGRFDR